MQARTAVPYDARASRVERRRRADAPAARGPVESNSITVRILQSL
jgi:hypothetical protein